MQYTFEPIMIELKRLNSSNLSDVAMVQPSIADPMKREFLAQTAFKDRRADLSQAHNFAPQSKQALKKSSETKTLVDVALILANVSSFIHIFCVALASHFMLQAQPAILHMQAAVLSVPSTDTTMSHLLNIFESSGCYNQPLEQYL